MAIIGQKPCRKTSLPQDLQIAKSFASLIDRQVCMPCIEPSIPQAYQTGKSSLSLVDRQVCMPCRQASCMPFRWVSLPQAFMTGKSSAFVVDRQVFYIPCGQASLPQAQQTGKYSASLVFGLIALCPVGGKFCRVPLAFCFSFRFTQLVLEIKAPNLNKTDLWLQSFACLHRCMGRGVRDVI